MHKVDLLTEEERKNLVAEYVPGGTNRPELVEALRLDAMTRQARALEELSESVSTISGMLEDRIYGCLR